MQTIDGPQGKLVGFETGHGDGVAALFLHSDCGRATQWAEMLGRIGDGRRAVAFDFRGHGDSDPAADRDYSYSGRAADVAAVADAVGLHRCVIVAHSGGAAVALQFAVDHPDRVAGLFLVDPPTDPRATPQEVRDRYVADLAGANGLDGLKAYYSSIAGSNPAVRAQVLADCERVDTAAMTGVARALAEWNPEPTLRAWRGPMFIVATKAGDNPAALFRLRPDLAHQILDHDGHWVQLDLPDIVERLVRDFIAAVP